MPMTKRQAQWRRRLDFLFPGAYPPRAHPAHRFVPLASAEDLAQAVDLMRGGTIIAGGSHVTIVSGGHVRARPRSQDDVGS